MRAINIFVQSVKSLARTAWKREKGATTTIAPKLDSDNQSVYLSLASTTSNATRKPT